jgi:hypothetical protein
MKQNSRQNKARYLQNLVKDKICKTFNLDNKDVRTSTLGENGEDVKLLTLTAKRVFPYATECKNTEQFIGLYKHREPLLIIKMNRQQPLAVISLEHFFELLEKED